MILHNFYKPCICKIMLVMLKIVSNFDLHDLILASIQPNVFGG